MTPRILLPEAWATWGWVVESCAARHGVTVDDVLGRGRTAEVVRSRHDLIDTLVTGHGLGFAEVGRLLGMSHTTVMAAWRKGIAA